MTRMNLPRLWENLAHRLSTEGLPLTARPYRDLGHSLGLSEAETMQAATALQQLGVLNRFGVILRNRALGFTVNGMCVFDLPDARLAQAGAQVGALPFVSLCYARRRQPPVWPFNLFCMIHGRDRQVVTGQFRHVHEILGTDIPADILISRRCFKQRGASYAPEATPWTPSTDAS